MKRNHVQNYNKPVISLEVIPHLIGLSKSDHVLLGRGNPAVSLPHNKEWMRTGYRVQREPSVDVIWT